MTKRDQFKSASPNSAQSGAGLQAFLDAAQGEHLPPVETWNPAYCGDIGMEIRRDGTWFYQNSPIGRKPMVKLFSRILRRDTDNNHYLVTPVEKVIVHVEDAPFLAVEMEVIGKGPAQALNFRTNLDDVVACSRENPLRFVIEQPAGGLKPYLLVRGKLEALVTRALYYDLVELAEAHPDHPDAQDGLGIWSRNTWFPLQA